MKYVVIDLEMNPIASVYKAERTTCKLEVIEIGAVLLDESTRKLAVLSLLSNHISIPALKKDTKN